MHSKNPLMLVLFVIGFFIQFAFHNSVIAGPTNPPIPRNDDHHIVSFVNQKRLKASKLSSDNLINFDFENVRNDINGKETAFERLAEHLDMTLKTNGPLAQPNGQKKSSNAKTFQRLQQTDDAMDIKQNTLIDMNELFASNKHHESPGSADVMWQRNKQSIPVLETVRHFVNSINEGALNHTIPNRNPDHHHKLIGPGHNATTTGGGEKMVPDNENANKEEENPAIETEEERVHTEESTSFKLLELLGSFGGILWNFLMSIQKFFAASSGGASSSSSSQASASSSGSSGGGDGGSR